MITSWGCLKSWGRRKYTKASFSSPDYRIFKLWIYKNTALAHWVPAKLKMHNETLSQKLKQENTHNKTMAFTSGELFPLTHLMGIFQCLCNNYNFYKKRKSRFFFVILALFCFLRQDIMYTKLVSNTLLAQDDFELDPPLALLPECSNFTNTRLCGWMLCKCCVLPTEPKTLVPN